MFPTEREKHYLKDAKGTRKHYNIMKLSPHRKKSDKTVLYKRHLTYTQDASLCRPPADVHPPSGHAVLPSPAPLRLTATRPGPYPWLSSQSLRPGLSQHVTSTG